MTTNSDIHAALRIIDANTNRSLEGLRVVEDFARFRLNDKHLASLYKESRHELVTALASLPQQALLAARDTSGDVGTQIEASDEYSRDSAVDVAVASQKRVEQALRCIEEYAKTVAHDVASAVEQLRYRVYSLGKAVAATAASHAKLSETKLYVLVDARPSLDAFDQLVRALTDAKVDVIQLRDKQLCDRELIARGHALRKITLGTNTLFIVNDRPDIAAIVGADGVHVGQAELSTSEARSILGPNRLIGVSTHSIEQSRQAVLDGADYIGCGPTFPSQTKQFEDFPGMGFLQAVADEISLPAFAIGGITPDNLPQVLEAGFQRIAVSNCVTAASSPRAVVRKMKASLSRRSRNQT